MSEYNESIMSYKEICELVAEQRDEIAQLRRELAEARELYNHDAAKWHDENARLQELKTPASRELLNITKALLDDANAENERLTERGMETEAWCNQLRVENARLTAALQKITAIEWDDDIPLYSEIEQAQAIARRELERGGR